MIAERIAISTAQSRRNARAAGLKYQSDRAPGIQRRRKGRAFEYLDPNGHLLRDRRTLQRIEALAIPPAWTHVWISARQNAHLQATGRDAKGRKQYRYHPRWREVRDETKFDRMLEFGQNLPKIRAHVERDFRTPLLSRTKLLATVIRLLDRTLIRVGNEEYARTNDSYGLTTLREKHVRVRGTHVRFHFRGKSGKQHEIDLEDARLARVVRRCQAIPGHELFHYLDETGKCRLIESADVNDYLRLIAARDFTAKDFRTWAGTVLAAVALTDGDFSTATRANRHMVRAVRGVAARLGNTPAVCRRSYIHPAIFEAFKAGRLSKGSGKHAGDGSNDVKVEVEVLPSLGRFVKGKFLHEPELRVMHLLQHLKASTPTSHRRSA